MTDEIDIKPDNEDGDKIAQDEKSDTRTDTEPKELKETKSVSFNRDVHVKRFGKPRELRGASSEHTIPSVRKEPFTHLSEQELIDEANKVIAQAQSVTCTTDDPPEKFFSLPHRRKLKEDKLGRRNSDDGNSEIATKSTLGRSTSDVSSKKRKERTSLSTLFRRAQRNKSPDVPVVVTTKPVAIVKRSKSDVSDLKSNTNLQKIKPIRKRAGSESEEFLKSLRNTKSQLSPIIESSPREDYFKKTSPLELFEKQNLFQKDIVKSDDLNFNYDITKVNPVEKPPRYKTPDKQEPKPPVRAKRGKSLEKDKEKSPAITDTPKRKTDVKKTLLLDEIDLINTKDTNATEIKDRIKESIRKIEENVYGDKAMIHSSQLPPDKPPLTRGQTVGHIVRILKEDQTSPSPKTHLISPPNGSYSSQPFSYIKPSISPDPNLFVRATSPDRVPSPVNKMADKGVVYAQVVKDHGDHFSNKNGKQTIHKTYSPSREKFGNFSDEDEGLGYEERYKHNINNRFNHNVKTNNNENYNSHERYKITDSPIRPRVREYKLTSFEDFEPIYANEYTSGENHNFIDTYRGRGDGMDTKKKSYDNDNKIDLDFNELSHRRRLLESRLNARRADRENVFEIEPISRYLPEPDPIYEAEKRRKATEKYVDETARYYHHTLERDGFTESSVTEDYNKYESDNHKYNTESRIFPKVCKDEVDRREFIDNLEPEPRYRDGRKVFPPEPEYEPPSLEFNSGKPVLTQDEYKEKKYKVKKNINSSQELLQTGQKYKIKDVWFGNRKGHYASNPEIAQEREDDYANIRSTTKQTDSYHNSLRRVKNKDKHYKNDFHMRRHGSGDSRVYYRDERSPRRFDTDNRLVDSGIENDFRKDSSIELHRQHRKYGCEEDVYNTSMFLASERRHTENNYPSEQIYANGEYLAKFKDFPDESYRKQYVPRERSADEGTRYDSKNERVEKSPIEEKVCAKPPKATKKLSGLEKMKQLFSRDSSKKSKKEKEVVQPQARTRVLKSPEHLARDDSEYRRYTDPEPNDIVVKKINYDCQGNERRIRDSREELNIYRNSNSPERKFKETDFDDSRYERNIREDRRYMDRKDDKRHNSSDRESDHHSRRSDAENDLQRSRSKITRPLDSPAMAERYRERRRLATPSPTPSLPRRQASVISSTPNWFKSLDRLAARKKVKNTKVERGSVQTSEDERRKTWSKITKPLNSPAKNLRFFGDTDLESDGNVKQSVTKSRIAPKPHSALRKVMSNSSTGLDEVDHSELSAKSYSLSNLREEESPKTKYYKRNLRNISELSNSENESQVGRRHNKPPISPYDRSRSHSSSKTLKGSKPDLRRRTEERGSSSELKGSKQDISRNLKHRRRTLANNSGESSTEGDSSHQSQRSVVYLHATTVGDIPDPGHVTRNRSRDDVSSINSSNLQVRSTTKSFSIFAPWTPRHYSDQHDVHYAQRPRKSKTNEVKKPSSRSPEESPGTLHKKKSYSQTTLSRRPHNSRLTSSNQTLYRKDKKKDEQNQSTLSRMSAGDTKKSQSSEILSNDTDRDRVSRSVSMPKDSTKKAGWFKLSSKKKPETNTRVR
ncbi:hypothetical protein ACJJTC_000597 [Scirpophaga incertulas]